MSNSELPRSIAPETCLDFPVSEPPVVSQPSAPDPMIPESCTEPHVIVFEKLHAVVDDRSIEIIKTVFNGLAEAAIQKAHDAEVGDIIEIQKTEMETAHAIYERVREELIADRDQGYEGHALQFSVTSASRLTRG